MIRIRRTVLGSVRIRDGVAVAVCQARYVSVDSLFPAGPTLIAPAPCVVRQEAMRALGAFGVGYGRRPARVDAVAPGPAKGEPAKYALIREVHSETKASLPTEKSTSGSEATASEAASRAAAASCSAFACSAAAIRASSSARAASSAAMRAASSSASIASMPCEMSRDAVLVSTVDSRVEPSDTLAKSAESAMATFASAPPMPKESISCTAPLPAEANPKPMHPVSTHDAQPTAIILAARFDFFCI